MTANPAILIVEDEPTLAKNMRKYLENVSFEVQPSGTGISAVAGQDRMQGELYYFHQKRAGDSGLDKLIVDSGVMLDLKQQVRARRLYRCK